MFSKLHTILSLLLEQLTKLYYYTESVLRHIPNDCIWYHIILFVSNIRNIYRYKKIIISRIKILINNI